MFWASAKGMNLSFRPLLVTLISALLGSFSMAAHADLCEDVAQRTAQSLGGVEIFRASRLEAIASSTATSVPLVEGFEIGSKRGEGLNIEGRATRIFLADNGPIAYLGFTGEVRLTENHQGSTVLLSGQGVEQHQKGYGTPVGTPNGFDVALESLTPAQFLAAGNFEMQQQIRLEYPSGVVVEGTLEAVQAGLSGRLAVIKFTKCRVSFGKHVLYKAGWGEYDLLVGARVLSVKTAVRL